jgi:hypothetical protein
VPSSGRWVRQSEVGGKVTELCVRGSESKLGSASLTILRAQIRLRLPLPGRGYGNRPRSVGVLPPFQSPRASEPSQMIDAADDGYLLWT